MGALSNYANSFGGSGPSYAPPRPTTPAAPVNTGGLPAPAPASTPTPAPTATLNPNILLGGGPANAFSNGPSYTQSGGLNTLTPTTGTLAPTTASGAIDFSNQPLVGPAAPITQTTPTVVNQPVTTPTVNAGGLNAVTPTPEAPQTPVVDNYGNVRLTDAKQTLAQEYANKYLGNTSLNQDQWNYISQNYTGSNLENTIKKLAETQQITKAYQDIYGVDPTAEQLTSGTKQFNWKNASTGTTELLNNQIADWTNQLNTGTLTPESLSDVTGMTSKVSDKLLGDYIAANPESAATYANSVATSVLGDNYNASPAFTTFKTDLDNQLQSGKITASQYSDQLENSTFNKNQEAGRFVNMATTVLGIPQQEAVKIARDLVSGNSANSPYTNIYKTMLNNPNSGQVDFLTYAASQPNAAELEYFKNNPNLLQIYKPLGEAITTRNGGAGQTYGSIDGKPILSAAGVDAIFDKKGSNWITGDLGKLDNNIGWDPGAQDQLFAKGAAALGIKKNDGGIDFTTGDQTPTTYSGDMAAVAKHFGIDASRFKDVYKTVTDTDPETGEQIPRQVLVTSAQDQLYNAIDNATQDIIMVAGKSGTKAGGIGKEYDGVMQDAAFDDAPKNHAMQRFQKVGDKYVPIGDTTYYTGEMEMSSGSWLSNSFIGDIARMPGIAELALLTPAAPFYPAIKAGQTAAAGGDFNDVVKAGALSFAAQNVLPNVSQNVGQTILPGFDPAIQNIIGRGVTNLGVNVATGTPFDTALTNTAINTGLNLGANQANIPNTPVTQTALNLAIPAITGNLNSNTMINAGTNALFNAAKQQQPAPSKEGGLVHMKTGGKVKGGLPHFEDGGYASLDFSYPSYDISLPSSDFGLDTSSWDFNVPSFEMPSFDFGLDTSSWDFDTPSFNYDYPSFDLENVLPEVVTTASPDIFDPFAETIKQQIDGNLPTLPSDVTSANSGFSSIDNRSPTVLDVGPGASNTDAFDFTSGQAYNNQATGIDELVYEAANPGIDVQIMDDGSKLFIDENTNKPLGGVDENGRSFHVDQNGRGIYDDTGEPTAGTPVKTFGGNLANKADVDKLLNYNAGYGTNTVTNNVKQIADTITKILGGGGATPQQKQQQKTAPDAGGLTNLVGSVTKSNPGFTLSGAPTYQPTVNPMYKAAGGRINLPQFQALNNYIDHNFDSNYAPQMAKGGQAQGGGLDHVPEFYSEGGLKHRYVKGRGDGTSDEIPAMLANGEFVIPADVVSGLGNGSNDSGAKILDEFLKVIRRDKRAASSDKLPADSKGPQAYLLQAKRKVRK